MTETRPRAPKFISLEAARGLAAILVTLHHTGNIMAQPRFYDAEPFGGQFRNLHVGVDFFFVLSGFLITWMHWEDIGQPGRLPPYMLKRFLRIYPPYWGVAVPLALLYLAFPDAGLPSQHDPFNIVFSLLLLPSPATPVLGVAWTLVHEIFFYMLFGLIIRLGRRALWILPAWALAIVLAAPWAPEFGYPYSFFFSDFNLQFLIGAATAALLRQGTIPFSRALAGAGAAGFVLLIVLTGDAVPNTLEMRLLFGLSAGIFILGAVETERRRPLRVPYIARFVGAASYAIYLVHPIALSAAAHLLDRTIGTFLAADVAATALAFSACLAGIIYHILAENRLIAITRQLIARLLKSSARTGPEPSGS